MPADKSYKAKITINPDYQTNDNLRDFLSNITDRFANEGKTLYDKRNVIKSFIVDESDNILNDVIVKKYKSPNIVQRIGYSFFRPGKAKRAFRNATILRERSIDTPLELAYIEHWKSGLIDDTYFISASDYAPPIQEKLNDLEDFDQVLAKDFAEFAAELHLKGILHHDLNQTNVQYHLLDNGYYAFSVIDINRMKVYPIGEEINIKDCFDNLTRFTRRMDLFEFVAKHYIEKRDWDSNLLEKAIRSKIKFDENRHRKKAFLAKFKSKK